MLFLRMVAIVFISMGGAYLGIIVAETTLAAWWIGIATLGLALTVAVGA